MSVPRRRRCATRSDEAAVEQQRRQRSRTAPTRPRRARRGRFRAPRRRARRGSAHCRAVAAAGPSRATMTAASVPERVRGDREHARREEVEVGLGLGNRAAADAARSTARRSRSRPRGRRRRASAGRPSGRRRAAASRRRAAPRRGARRRGSRRERPGCSSRPPRPRRARPTPAANAASAAAQASSPGAGALAVAAHEIGAEPERDERRERRRGALPSRQSVLRDGARSPGAGPGVRAARLASSRGDAAEALSPHAGPDARAAGGARRAGRAGDPSPLARLQGGLRRDARAPAAGLPHRERGARLHRVRHRRVRVGVRQPPLAGREGARRLARRVRHALAEAGGGVRLRRRRADLRLGRRRRAPRTSRARLPRAAPGWRSSFTRRPRPASSPTSARSSPRATTRARSRSSTRSRASVPCRSRRTRGGSTSSSPARRRR